VSDEELAYKLRAYFKVQTNLKASEMMIGFIDHLNKQEEMIALLTAMLAPEAPQQPMPPQEEMN
jgi:hypothetical protein